MSVKLVIINNGLKNLRGHYFETSVSIAEAAHCLGIQPILATHVDCPDEIVPEWLEFKPIFCTDHWMISPLPLPPDLQGIRGDYAALSQMTIESVLNRVATFQDYLLTRFDEVACEIEKPILAAKPAQQTDVRSLSWKAFIKRSIRRATPPVILSPLRKLYDRKLFLVKALKLAFQQVFPPFLYDRIRRLWSCRFTAQERGIKQLLRDNFKEMTIVAANLPAADQLKLSLTQIGASQEYDYTILFQRDLERLLCLAGCTPRDHVYLPTAHGRELIAIQRLLDVIGQERSPTFHLEFRHSMNMSGCHDDPDFEHPYCTCHRVYFDHYRTYPPSSRIRLYTDTPELSEEYQHFSGLEFGVLPIPFRSHLIKTNPHRLQTTLCLAYFGDVRDEKGFFWLPDLVQELMDDYVRTGKVCFLIQGTLAHPDWDMKSHAALVRLKQYPPESVELVGLDKPLAPEAYYQLVSKSDVLLCPYSPAAYRSRSSGTFTEAIAAGIPTIVPMNTWLSRQQPPGSGEAFVGRESFLEGVKRICDRYPAYLSRAQESKDFWLSIHSPTKLVEALVEEKTRRDEAGSVGNAA